MPIKNTVKQYSAPAYYHIYNRGAGGGEIFCDDQDREKFISLFARYLDAPGTALRSDGVPYETYPIELVAYCLMSNHFHLLMYQEKEPEALTRFMRSLSTAYTMYFNRKYRRSGHLFQSVFKAVRIDTESYLLHITRYVHMNPRRYLRYRWSSIRHYLGEPTPSWLHMERVNDMLPQAYRQFLEEYEGKKVELQNIKQELANSWF